MDWEDLSYTELDWEDHLTFIKEVEAESQSYSDWLEVNYELEHYVKALGRAPLPSELRGIRFIRETWIRPRTVWLTRFHDIVVDIVP